MGTTRSKPVNTEVSVPQSAPAEARARGPGIIEGLLVMETEVGADAADHRSDDTLLHVGLAITLENGLQY